MQLTKPQISFLAYILLIILIALFSWLAFVQASLDASLIYQPLKSYFVPIKTNIDYPTWLLASEKIHIKFHYKLINQICNCIMALGFMAVFYLITQNKNLELKQIQKYSLAIALIAIFLIPADSSDLLGYIARGFQQLDYEVNPFATVIADIEGWRQNPILANTLWQHNPSPYGPLFMLFTKFIAAISFHNLWLALFNFKLANFFAFIGILKILERLALPNHLYALIALNPFIIVEAIWNAHNDIYMALAILLAFYLAKQEKYNLSIFILIISILIKYISVVLLPLILIDSYRSKKLPWLGLSSGLALTASLVWHFQLLSLNYDRISENINLSHKSLYDLLNSIFKYTSASDLPEITRYIFLSSFIVLALSLYYKFAKEKNSQAEIYNYAFWILFALICLFSPKFHSWYLLMFMPLGILVEPSFIFALSITHLLSLTPLDQMNIANFLVMTGLPSFILLRHPNILRKLI